MKFANFTVFALILTDAAIVIKGYNLIRYAECVLRKITASKTDTSHIWEKRGLQEFIIIPKSLKFNKN